MTSIAEPRRGTISVIVAAFIVGLLLVALLRFLDVHAANPPAVAGYATLLYVVLTVVVAVALTHRDVPFQRLGFGPPFRPLQHVLLALAGVAVLIAAGWILTPLWEKWPGGGRDLSRFADVVDSPAALAKLLLLSWTVAAIGEELAFRIVLLRGLAYVLGDTRVAFGVALIAQALVFGAVHAYQGPVGVAGTIVSGLVYGSIVLAARGSIWPAVLAHGLNNTIGIMELYLG